MKNKKIYFTIAILLLAIGFAAGTTTLIMTGSSIIGSMEERFIEDVIFTKASTEKDGKAFISNDGKTITFTSRILSKLNESTFLEFAITNRNQQYDADVSINCKKSIEAYAEYINVTSNELHYLIKATDTVKDSISVSLIKSYLGNEEINATFTCDITANAVERESVAPKKETFNYFGFFVDDIGNPVKNAQLVIYSHTPHYVTTDDRGYFFLDGIEGEELDLYYIQNKSEEELKDMTKNEIVDAATSYAEYSKTNTVFQNQYRIVDNILETKKTRKYSITFDADGGTINPVTKEVTHNEGYGTLPTPTKTGCTFLGWFLGDYKVEPTTIVANIETHTLKAKWSINDYVVTFNANGGTTATKSKTITFGGKYGILPIPTRTGYIFKGWYLGSTNILESTVVSTGENHTLTAKWELTIATDAIKDLVGNSNTELLYDGTSDNNLRYVGTSPNNYVKFNNELWRIIGVMNNVDDTSGDASKKIKIVRDTSIGVFSWDNTGADGKNNWPTSAIQKILNEGPYWNRTSGSCPSGANGATTSCNFSSYGLTSSAKSMISKVTWKLGAIPVDNIENTTNGLVKHFYNYERGTFVYTGNARTWNGNIGLMYPSDYGYAVGGTSRDACLNYYFRSWDSHSECYQNNWLSKDIHSTRLITSNGANNKGVMRINSNPLDIGKTGYGKIGYDRAVITNGIRPSVYLVSNIKITGGSGTSTNPYSLSL